MVKYKDACFVIMPFSDTKSHTEEYWTNHFEFFLKPFINKKLKMDARRSKPLTGDILDKIITDLTNSKLVIADITDVNPNVFWELGVRHSFVKNGTVIIAEKGTKIPFDLVQEGTHFYLDHSNNNPNTINFFKDLERAINGCYEKPEFNDSPVFTSISGRGTMYEIINKDEIIRKIDGLLLELKENERNISILEDNIKICKDQKEGKSKDKSMYSATFCFSAFDYLIINRYLNEPNDFYSKCQNYIKWIRVLDEGNQSITDHNDLLSKEKWFVKHIPTIREKITELITFLDKIKEQMKMIR